MKTPREILLARSAAAERELAAIERNVLAQIRKGSPPAPSGGGARRVWEELFVPCRYAWGALAATWLVIAALQITVHDAAPAAAADGFKLARKAGLEASAYRLMLAELAQLEPAGERRAPQPAARPRSQRRAFPEDGRYSI